MRLLFLMIAVARRFDDSACRINILYVLFPALPSMLSSIHDSCCFYPTSLSPFMYLSILLTTTKRRIFLSFLGPATNKLLTRCLGLELSLCICVLLFLPMLSYYLAIPC